MELQVKVGFDQEALKFLSAMVLTLGGKLMGGATPEGEALATESLRKNAGLTEEVTKTVQEETKKAEETKKPEAHKKEDEVTNIVTKEQLNAAAVDAKARLGGDIKKIKDLLTEFGAPKISEVAEDKRAEFLARLEAL